MSGGKKVVDLCESDRQATGYNQLHRIEILCEWLEKKVVVLCKSADSQLITISYIR